MLRGKMKECEYGDCTNMTDEITEVAGEYFSCCPDCQEKVSDETGYCPVECMMGHGCDQSC
jgi:hypothetical protein